MIPRTSRLTQPASLHQAGLRRWVYAHRRAACRIVALGFSLVAVVTGGCGSLPGVLLPNESTAPVDTNRFTLLVRFAHISDAHIMDEESPGRLTAAAQLASTAWRPQDAYTTQLLDGFIRTVNKIHAAQQPIDFLVHTGDAMDNAQFNELQWFVRVMDGGMIDPRSGPDDRDPTALPDPLLDPHEPFEAQGLYRQGVHGPLTTIPWYSVFGNHDHFASGVFPIVTNFFGTRISPLPVQRRVGLFFPVNLDPTGTTAWAPISPAHPGPPPTLNLPMRVTSNPMRRFITDREFIAAHLRSLSSPPGHGFSASQPDRRWYSVAVAPGVRLISLNSATPGLEFPTAAYSEGAISREQIDFLTRELTRAQQNDECVIVATHHPASYLEVSAGTALTDAALVDLLNRFPQVVLHISGHAHRHLVIDRGNYVEMITGSIIDPPQEGRIVEIWRAGDDIELRYRFFSHLDDIQPTDDTTVTLFNDPLRPLRQVAADLANSRLP